MYVYQSIASSVNQKFLTEPKSSTDIPMFVAASTGLRDTGCRHVECISVDREFLTRPRKFNTLRCFPTSGKWPSNAAGAVFIIGACVPLVSLQSKAGCSCVHISNNYTWRQVYKRYELLGGPLFYTFNVNMPVQS
jgi:hypothetical protein